ncbi:serine/threonine protein kinase [Brevibacillus daliensis]|uniref:serine/threonine protein kinase n=1 Tax=Brevibacillus daliensis TaxID=2892995 RepID=UPI001E63629C|nr:serine/threonine-protein kinase [Brevibacillus daliensis]
MQDINGYKVVRNLGGGSFGTTYQVEKDGVHFALKLIRENIMNKEAIDSRRIEREIRILKEIENPFVVKYIDDGYISDGLQKYRYIVMEYADGETLEQYLSKNTLTIQDSCLLVKNIFQGINALHKENVIHRDLKPANIMITSKSNDIKILDFGISKLIDASTLTVTGQMMGTYAYMPPEQLNSAKEIDYRADYYSAAVILYEAITGERPLKMRNQLEAIRKILMEIPEPLAKLSPNVPIDISEMVEVLLKKEPYERSISFEEIILRLDRHRRIVNRTSSKITSVYFNTNLEFLPMTIHNDTKSVVEYHNQNKIKGAIFNAPQLIQSPKNFQLLASEQNLKLIIDPSTQTLGYSAFTQKPTYKKLPYLINPLKKETPNDFLTATSIQQRVKGVLDYQLKFGATLLLSPFHFLDKDDSDWINVDYNTYKESKSYLLDKNIKLPLYYGISLDIEQYEETNKIKDLVNLITSANPDGFYLQIAGSFDSTNSNHYYSYAYLVKLLAETKKEIILTRINDFSLGLLALGANSIATGLGQSDNFREGLLNKAESTGGAVRRYYIEDLMGLFNKNILQDILSTSAGKKCICNCMYCNGSVNPEHLSQFNNAINHHLYTKHQQMEKFSALQPQERLKKFTENTSSAIQLIKDINREKRIKNFGHSHIETWRDVILEVSKTKLNYVSQF